MVFRRALVAALGLVVAAWLVGCVPGAPRTHTLTFPGQGDLAQLPVVLDDRTGLVVRIEPGPGDVPGLVDDDAAIGLPGDPTAVVVRWLGGMCDKQANLTLEDRQGTLWLSVRTDRDFGGCRLAGISRPITLYFATPVDATRIRVAQVDS
jgi:hypothetical protein